MAGWWESPHPQASPPAQPGRSMDIRQLRYFVHVAEMASFSRASVFLGIAQPALSRQIRLLEEALGTQLLHRHGRGVSLTSAGERLLERSTRLLADFDTIRAEMTREKSATDRLSGDVTLSLPIPVSPLLSIPLVNRCRKLYPDISLRIVEGFSGLIHEWLLSGSIQLALLYGPAPSRMIIARPLIIEDLYVITPSTPELREKSDFTLAELALHPLVLPHRPHAILNLLRDAGMHPAKVLEADALALMIQLVIDQQGFSILPITAVTRDIEAGRVLAIPIARPSISWTVSLCHVANRPVSPAAAAVGRIVEAEIQDLTREGRWPARLAS